MKKIVAALLFLGMFGVAFTANAAPAFTGSTGMINTPSADVLKPGQISLGAYTRKDVLFGSIGANVAPNLELSFSASNKKSFGTNSLNAKYALVDETILSPGLAVGVEDIAGDKERSWYASMSKGLILGMRLHAGYGSGQYDGFFAALEKSISPVSIGGIGETKLILEWDSHHLNYGIRVAVAPGLKVDAGVKRHHGYLGVSFVN
jgi:hypothetical protein